MQDATSVIYDRSDPNGRPTDVAQSEPDVSASGSGGTIGDIFSTTLDELYQVYQECIADAFAAANLGIER